MARHVDWHCLGLAPRSAYFVRDRRGGGLVDVGHHHHHPQFARSPGKPRANSRPGSGDDGYAAGEFFFVWSHVAKSCSIKRAR